MDTKKAFHDFCQQTEVYKYYKHPDLFAEFSRIYDGACEELQEFFQNQEETKRYVLNEMVREYSGGQFTVDTAPHWVACLRKNVAWAGLLGMCARILQKQTTDFAGYGCDKSLPAEIMNRGDLDKYLVVLMERMVRSKEVYLYPREMAALSDDMGRCLFNGDKIATVVGSVTIRSLLSVGSSCGQETGRYLYFAAEEKIRLCLNDIPEDEDVINAKYHKDSNTYYLLTKKGDEYVGYKSDNTGITWEKVWPSKSSN